MLVVKVDILLLILIAFAIIVEPYLTGASTENSKLVYVIDWIKWKPYDSPMRSGKKYYDLYLSSLFIIWT